MTDSETERDELTPRQKLETAQRLLAEVLTGGKTNGELRKEGLPVLCEKCMAPVFSKVPHQGTFPALIYDVTANRRGSRMEVLTFTGSPASRSGGEILHEHVTYQYIGSSWSAIEAAIQADGMRMAGAQEPKAEDKPSIHLLLSCEDGRMFATAVEADIQPGNPWMVESISPRCELSLNFELKQVFRLCFK